MKKLQNLSFTFVLLFIANLSFSQDVAEKKSSKNLINTDSISSLNPYIEDHTEQLNIKMIVSNNQLKYLLPYDGKSYKGATCTFHNTRTRTNKDNNKININNRYQFVPNNTK